MVSVFWEVLGILKHKYYIRKLMMKTLRKQLEAKIRRQNVKGTDAKAAYTDANGTKHKAVKAKPATTRLIYPKGLKKIYINDIRSLMASGSTVEEACLQVKWRLVKAA
jgi:hypothetical protein